MAYRAKVSRLPDSDPEELLTPADVDSLIDRMLVTAIDFNLAEICIADRPRPDQLLYLGVNGGEKVGALKYLDSSGIVVSRGTQEGQPTSTYCYYGTDTPFPPNADLPLDVIRQAVRAFLTSGGERPTCVQWQDDDL